MEFVTSIFQYIIDMGASVMLPIMIIILSLCVGVKLGKAVRSGLMIGVGFVGLGLIVNLMNDQLGPAAQQMSERFGLSLSVVDIGWPGMSPITWTSSIAIIAIPIAILVNLIMLALKWTKTVNIDIWNVWHITFTGAIVFAVTNNYWLGILALVIQAMIVYKLGDLWGPICTDYFEIEGLTSPHGTSAYLAPIACAVDLAIEKIPGLNKINITSETLQEKVGVLGEPIVIGFLLGAIIGMLAGYPINSSLMLGVNMSAVMVLMPKIVKCIMEGLMPLSERAREILTNKFGNGEFYIGMDPAVLLGDSQVVTAGLIFIPITLLLAVILPGNRVLPFGDLATISFFIAIAVGIHKGNLFRTLVSGTVIMALTLWICNQAIDWTTALAVSTGSVSAGSLVAAMDQGGSPLTYVITSFFSGTNFAPALIIGLFYIVCILCSIKVSRTRKAAIEAAEEEWDEEDDYALAAE